METTQIRLGRWAHPTTGERRIYINGIDWGGDIKAWATKSASSYFGGYDLHASTHGYGGMTRDGVCEWAFAELKKFFGQEATWDLLVEASV